MVVYFLNALHRARLPAAPLCAGILCICAAGLLLCAKDENPFADLTNARAHITKLSFRTLDENDSLPIYSPHSIEFVVALREGVDSIVLIAPSNRAGDTIVLLPEKGAFDADAYSMRFSLTRTGIHTLQLGTVRSNGETVWDKIVVRAYSPLYQAPVGANSGGSVVLSTPRVGDDDVWYCWSFGDDVVRSTDSSLKTQLPAVAQPADTGYLWVTGLREDKPSPKVKFVFWLGDSVAPVIELAPGSPGVVRGDTIFLGDSSTLFQVKITDRGSISSATLNGTPMTSQPGTALYSAVLRDVYTHPRPSPLTLLVKAVDQSGNTARDTFFVVYDPTAAKGPGLAITFITPATNPSVCASNMAPIIANILDLRANALSVRIDVTVNGVAYATDRTGSATGAVTWVRPVKLTLPTNTIAISIADTLHNDRLDASLTIAYSPGEDSAPPVIADLSVDGVAADGYYSTADSVVLRIIAFDLGSGIDSLLVNGTPARIDTASEYIWLAKVGLVHTGATVHVYAVDKKGNLPAHKYATLYRNQPPRLISGIDPASLLRARQLFRCDLVADDPDGDPVTITPVTSPTGLAVNGTVLTWTPVDSQVHSHTIVLQLWDGRAAVFDTTTVTVVAATPSPPVLQLMANGLVVTDQITVYDSAAPMTVEVRILDPDPPPVDRHRVTIDQGGITVTMLDSTRQFSLTVDPALAAREYDTLRIIVVDATELADTATLVVRVVHVEPPVTPGGPPALLTFSAGQAGVTANLIDFPLLVRFTSTMMSSLNPRSLTGALRFTKKNGAALAYEVERWNAVAGLGEVWVLIDTVHAGVSVDSIYARWDSAAVSLSSGSAVFDTGNGFAGVWHLAKTGQTTDDATIRRQVATCTGTRDTAAAIGRGLSFNGVSDYVQTPSTDKKTATSFTASAWFRSVSSQRTGHVWWEGPAAANGFGDEGVPTSHESHFTVIGTDDDPYGVAPAFEFRYGYGDPTGTPAPVSVDATPVGGTQWHHVAVVMQNAGTAPNATMYIDGVVAGQKSSTQTDRSAWDTALRLGRPGTAERFFSGYIDQFELSTTPRSSDWIKLCYETQKPGSAVVEFNGGMVPSGSPFTIGDTSSHPISSTVEDCAAYVNTLHAVQATLDRTATLESISMYVHSFYSPPTIRMGIYDASRAGGLPGALVAQTNEFSPGNGWNTQAVTAPAVLQQGTYWICFVTNSNNLTYGCLDGVGVRTSVTLTYGPLPATAPAMGNAGPGTRSLYATLR